MENKITVTQKQLENLSLEISLIGSLAITQQREIDEIVIDKERYKNVDIRYQDKFLAFDLAEVILQKALKLSDDVQKLIMGGD